MILKNGVRFDFMKIEVIFKMLFLIDKKGVECFLGIVNYFVKFVFNMLVINEFIRFLFRSDVLFIWEKF